MSILLVEDDPTLANGLTKALQKKGFTVNHVSKGADALHVIAAEPPDLVILDLGLPDMDGMQVLGKLRSTAKELPVLMLTARDSLTDKVAGLESGADDYLAKPFEMAELLARVGALSRRINTATSHLIAVADIELDTASQQVRVQGQSVELRRREYMLLQALMENCGRVQTRENLERKLYSWGEEVSSNALEVHIHRLRKKLRTDAVKTIRGVGYMIEPA